ncbi:MAG: hypothetical protein ACTHMI_22660 [Mucilaginibacter sp.]|uniref:hypothetical protein n=1 Tax=Mucilaginibacter sp. L3T2-6 TaxID=3062491 RepID=UPI00267614F8|nr:hypothetical protein [Mucilaginibacter sp. L3T2-6]MDO3644098.1 hypothetical protein [Mucilaginibacter sp. L3T2-6]MDV6216621.1 hypothetical protein [Mucilaginibacter sp. L3T2-6]
MTRPFEATLTGSEYPVKGTVSKINFRGYGNAYEFKSIDNDLHLIIAKDEDGNWVRLAGTEPFLSSWIDELAEQIA